MTVTDKLQILLSANELSIFSTKVDEGETPIWLHWEDFVTMYLRTGRSKVTVQSVKDTLKFVIRHLGILSIEKLNTSHLLEDSLFEVKEKRGLSNTTYNSYLKNINTYFIWLERRGIIQENNIKKVSRCKEEQNQQLTLSSEQVKLIIGQVNTRRQSKLLRLRNTLFIHLFEYTGARPCELLDLKLSSIQPLKEGYKIIIDGKKQKGKARYYACPSHIRDSLDAYLSHRNDLRPDEEFLFISSSKKSRWTYSGVRRFFNRLSAELGFKVTAYGFRRYVATKLYLHNGCTTEQVRDYLGHTRISTTMKYVEQNCARTMDASAIMAAGLV